MRRRFAFVTDPLDRHPLLVAIVVALVTLFLLESYIRIEQDRRYQAERAVVQARVSTVRARLESELNSTLSLSMGLSTFVLTYPGFTQYQLSQVAASLIRLRPNIVSVALAPDNVIRFIYPRGNNDRALGLHYLNNPEQRDAVLRLMREQRPVIAGPIHLVQDGIGIVNRIPIVRTRADGTLRYWGLASVAVDPEPIFRYAGVLPDSSRNMEYALRGKDGLGARGAVFLGRAALFDDPAAMVMDIVIPGGSWQLAARPLAMPSRWNNYVQALALLFALGAGSMAGYSLSAHRRIRSMALEDSLTGLANRHQFQVRGQDLFALARRSGRHLALLNIDLDDFKAINDQYGHEAGDHVLIHVANTLRACFRDSDLIARVGGDEFLVLLPDTANGEQFDALLTRLRTAVGEPVAGLELARPVGISVGSAACNERTTTLGELMREADAAMYRVKVAGKSERRN
jgi:diguanylate cyclase (GGDEF)-like protein